MKNKLEGVTVDSRQVKPGFAFVAIRGIEQDGHKFIDQAIINGASLIVHQDGVIKQNNIEYLQVEDSREYLSLLAAQFYTKQPKYILGVTGTSGKSSVVHYIREIFKLLAKKSVSIGTLGILGDLEIQSSLTTPATIDLHEILDKIANNGIEYAEVECSSHGIDQHRLTSVKFTACGFTNFSQDHLDYHQNMEEYFAVKKKLFNIMHSGIAVLNTDISEYKELLQHCVTSGHKVISYGKSKDADIQILSIMPHDDLQKIEFKIEDVIYKLEIKILGEFQVYNIACAIGLIASTGIKYQDIVPCLAHLDAAPGRLDFVANYNNAKVFVDYAHKPEALRQVLINLKSMTKNKLHVLFGCGGNRDQSKRQLMGEIACEFADYVIITDDNPRNENPSQIRQNILLGCNKRAKEIGNREEAISYALKSLQPGDNLLIAGKGHENYQIIGNNQIYFNDKEKVKELLKNG